MSRLGVLLYRKPMGSGAVIVTAPEVEALELPLAVPIRVTSTAAARFG